MKEWMAQADPPKKAIRWKSWMAGCYSSLQIKQHFTLKNGRWQVVLWKNMFPLQIFDASNRSS